jgi:ABC-type uncharacterized transport system substrate-binding protein
VTATDLWLIGALGIVVAIAIGILYPRLLAITLNEDLARTSGVPVAALNLVITILTALTTVIAMRMVGVLLVSAMMVIPALAGFALARSFRGALAIAMTLAVIAMGVGLGLAYYLRLAAGASVVLTALVLFALAGPARRLRNALSPALGALAAVALLPAIALAHPHVWIDYAVTVRFTADGPEGVRVDWAFDEMISALIIQKYDTDRDGRFSAYETRAIEKEHFVYLKEFNYFVEVKIDGAPMPITQFKDFEARNVKGQLHYLFTVPLPRGARRDGVVDVNVVDPTFYTAFTASARPIAADGASNHRVDCDAVRDAKSKLLEALRCTYRRLR